MIRRFGRQTRDGTKVRDGLVAGAAGTLALNSVTYADMVLRARPASKTPERSVQRIAESAQLNLGAGERAAHRRTGLGALLGYATGITTAVVFAAVANRRRPPAPVAIGLLSVGAMLSSMIPMAALGVTDPRRWNRADWLSDLIPHLVYGVVTAATWRLLHERQPNPRRRTFLRT